jgi:hypothetical protein
VSQNKHKKKDASTAPPDPSDPKSQDSLQLVPIGQDSQRKRFWVADGPCTFIHYLNACNEPLFACIYGDLFFLFLKPYPSVFAVCITICNGILTYLSSLLDSPRLYVSTNPWKITATFHTVSSTREEYLFFIDTLKASAPGELKKGEKRSKLEQAHIALITTLEGRIGAIDAELAVSLSPETYYTTPPAPRTVLYVQQHHLTILFSVYNQLPHAYSSLCDRECRK